VTRGRLRLRRLTGIGVALAVFGAGAGASSGVVPQPAVGAEVDPENFRYSFGDDGGDPAEYWRQIDSMGEDVLGAIMAVLDLPCAATDYGTGSLTFVWPAAAEIPFAELSLSERAGLAALYEGFDIDYYYMDGPEDGFYAGWRLYIDEDGRWTGFIAGD